MTLRHNVVNVICIIVRNILTRTHVGRRLFIEQSCLFNLSERFWWNKVVKVIEICFSCSMLFMDGLLLHLRQEAAIGLLGGSIREWKTWGLNRGKSS